MNGHLYGAVEEAGRASREADHVSSDARIAQSETAAALNNATLALQQAQNALASARVAEQYFANSRGHAGPGGRTTGTPRRRATHQ